MYRSLTCFACALRTSRFTPVHYRGKPQAIQYLFTFNFKLP